MVKEGVAPCFVLEIVSHFDARIRRTDEVDKVKLYERIGVEECFLVDMPRKGTEGRFRFKGYRLGPDRRYRPIEPDDRGRLLSETTGLLFGVSLNGDRTEVFDVASGERIRTPREEVEARERAERVAAREVEARKAAEEELARLRAEIERLRRTAD